jgi:DNA-binding MarR family transcriptional regulator
MAADKEILVVNAATGELYERRPRKTKRVEAFYMTNQKDAIELAKAGLSATEHNILRYLEGIMDYDNVASVAQSYLAEQLGTTEATVSISLKHLAEKGIVRKDRINGRWVFIVSSKASTRGKLK